MKVPGQLVGAKVRTASLCSIPELPWAGKTWNSVSSRRPAQCAGESCRGGQSEYGDSAPAQPLGVPGASHRPQQFPILSVDGRCLWHQGVERIRNVGIDMKMFLTHKALSLGKAVCGLPVQKILPIICSKQYVTGYINCITIPTCSR